MKDEYTKEDWYAKCMLCVHCYTRQDDADFVYCRLRKGICRFEEFDKMNKKSNLCPDKKEFTAPALNHKKRKE